MGMPQLVNLIRKSKEGCVSSRGQLLERFRKYLKTLARVQLYEQLRGKVDASDIVQDVFLNAHRAFGTFRGTTEAELCAWLRAILASQLTATSRFHEAAKRQVQLEQRLQSCLTESSIALDRMAIRSQPTPSQVASQKENRVLVANAIEDLPDDYRTVILLRHVRGLPYAKVANEMGRSVDSVKKLWVRALAQLQRTMEAMR